MTPLGVAAARAQAARAATPRSSLERRPADLRQPCTVAPGCDLVALAHGPAARAAPAGEQTAELAALEQRGRAFDFAVAQQAESARETSALIALADEQRKRDDALVREYIKTI